MTPDRTELIAKLATELLVTQLNQIQIWNADDVDILKIKVLCVAIAAEIVDQARSVQ